MGNAWIGRDRDARLRWVVRLTPSTPSPLAEDAGYRTRHGKRERATARGTAREHLPRRDRKAWIERRAPPARWESAERVPDGSRGATELRQDEVALGGNREERNRCARRRLDAVADDRSADRRERDALGFRGYRRQERQARQDRACRMSYHPRSPSRAGRFTA